MKLSEFNTLPAVMLCGLLQTNVLSAAPLNIDTVSVGNLNNLASSAGYGAVNYAYRIGTTEVTNAQYVSFLNAVDPHGTNPNAVYNPNMSLSVSAFKGGIDFNPLAQDGSKYTAKTNYGNKPVNYVNFYDAARFTNWLMTGDTENGFYVFNGATTLLSQGTHGPGFGGNYIAIADENEWYKAAYHANDGDTGNYYLYATGTNDVPTVASATATGDIANPGGNVANYNFGANWNGTEVLGLGNVTSVGSAGPGSASPYGTFDQSGNMLEWNDTLINANRVMRGGSMWLEEPFLRSTYRGNFDPENGGSSLGFRITSLAPVNVVPLPPAIYALGSVLLFGFPCLRRTRMQ